MALHSDDLELCPLDPHVHDHLPEDLDRLTAGDKVAVGRQDLPILRIEGRQAGRVDPLDGSHKPLVRSGYGTESPSCSSLSPGPAGT